VFVREDPRTSGSALLVDHCRLWIAAIVSDRCRLCNLADTVCDQANTETEVTVLSLAHVARAAFLSWAKYLCRLGSKGEILGVSRWGPLISQSPTCDGTPIWSRFGPEAEVARKATLPEGISKRRAWRGSIGS
jgi:hypothetical protein